MSRLRNRQSKIDIRVFDSYIMSAYVSIDEIGAQSDDCYRDACRVKASSSRLENDNRTFSGIQIAGRQTNW